MLSLCSGRSLLFLVLLMLSVKAPASFLCADIFAKNHEIVQLTSLVEKLLREKQSLIALDLVENALIEIPHNDNLLSLKTRILVAQEKYEEALAVAEQRSLLYPNLKALGSKAQLLTVLGRLEEALDVLDQKLRLDSTDGLNRKAKILYALQRYDEAIATADMKLASNPKDFRALDIKMQALQKLNRHEEVIAMAELVLTMPPPDAAALVKKTNALMSLGRYEEALLTVDQSLSLRPNDASALGTKTKALVWLQRYDEALLVIEKNLTINSSDIKALGMKANIFINLRMYKEALEIIDRLLNMDPNDSIALRTKLNAFFRLGKHEQVVSMAREYIASHPNDTFVLVTAIRSLMELHQIQEALNLIDQYLLPKNPSDIITLSLKARLLIRRAQPKEALSVLQRLPNGFVRDFYTAVALIDLKQYAKATEILTTLEPKPSVLWRLAQAHYSLGRLDLAYKNLIQMVQIEKGMNLGVITALIKIESLSSDIPRSPLVELIIKKFNVKTLAKIAELQDQRFWEMETPSTLDEVSIYNPFYSTLYSQPVDTHTRLSTK